MTVSHDLLLEMEPTGCFKSTGFRFDVRPARDVTLRPKTQNQPDFMRSSKERETDTWSGHVGRGEEAPGDERAGGTHVKLKPGFPPRGDSLSLGVQPWGRHASFHRAPGQGGHK